MTESVLIPAHNEAATVAGVVAAAVAAQVGPVVVVADNCEDDTAVLARRAGADVYRCDGGDKGSAVAAGLGYLARTRQLADRVLMLDADLLGLGPGHVRQFAESPTGVMTVGVRDSTVRVARLPGCRYIPPIGGERIVPLVVLQHTPLVGVGYRLEMLLAATCWRLGVPIAEIRLRGIKHPTRPSAEHHARRWREVRDGWLSSGVRDTWGRV